MKWATKSFGEVVDILDSRRIPVNADERAKRGGAIPYYGATGQVGFIDDHIFNEELVLLGEDGAPFLDSSKPKAYIVRGKTWVNNHAHVLRGKPGLLNSFLLHQLNCLDYRPYVSGTTRLKLPQGPMKRIPLIVPEESEQRRIVAEIEKQFTRLDAGVAALRRVQANLKRYRAAVLKAACDGKFASKKAVPYPKQALAKLGKWCGGGTPSKANRAFWTSGNIPWVSPKDMKTELISDAEDHITRAAVEQSATNLLSPDAVLVVTRSGILAHTLPVAVTTRAVALNQDIKALQLPPENSSRYVALALRAFQQEILQKCTKAGTTVQSIEFPVFLRFEIPLPALAEQKRIVAEVERRLSVGDELETIVTTNLARAARLRQSVLQKAFGEPLTV